MTIIPPIPMLSSTPKPRDIPEVSHIGPEQEHMREGAFASGVREADPLDNLEQNYGARNNTSVHFEH